MESKQGAATRGGNQDKPQNVILVSSKRKTNFYVNLAKKLFQDHESIEFHALGNAISMSVMATENLVR